MNIAKNCTKMVILEANFMIDLSGQIRIQFLDSMELKYLLDSKLDLNLPYPYLLSVLYLITLLSVLCLLFFSGLEQIFDKIRW